MPLVYHSKWSFSLFFSSAAGYNFDIQNFRLMWTHVDRGRGIKNLIFCGHHKCPLSKARYFIHHNHRDIELDYESEADKLDLESKGLRIKVGIKIRSYVIDSSGASTIFSVNLL